jgi:hypothetical protein
VRVQLKRRGRIGQALAAATYTLLAGSSGSVGAAENEQMDFTDLHYSEAGRVTVDEQVFALKRDKKKDKTFTLKLFHDAITGATPNGAANPSTFTSPSGQTYDSTLAQIVDERYAITADWQQEKSRLVKVSYGLSYSTELDYDSLGVNWKKQRDSKNRMRTYTYGLGVNYDVISAEGGIPTGLAPVTDTTRTTSDSKMVADFLAGVTQVINRTTLLQLNYSLGVSNGYLTDPYKIISVSGAPVDLQFENRPDLRVGHSLYVRFIQNRKGNVARLSYRYYTDDWGIISHTVDFKYRYRMNNKWYVQPRIRYYSQSAASFYGYIFYSADPVTGYASGDYRLGNLAGLTAGLQMGREFSRKLDANLRVEYLQQSDRLGNFEALNAVIAQMSFRYKF